MKLEVIRLLKADLADVTNGINARIAALTLDGSDTRPSNPTVYTDVDDKWVARRRIDDADSANITFPALAVFQVGPLEAMNHEEPVVALRDFEVTVGFRYLIKKQDSANAVRDGLYFNRALSRWFSRVLAQDPNGATRTKNGAIIAGCLAFVQGDLANEWDAADCVASTNATLWLRESSPT